MLKAETVETGFNQLKDTEWPAYKDGIDQSIEQLRGDIPTAESLAEDFVGKTDAQEMEGPLTINNTIASDGGLIVKCDGPFGGIIIADSTDTSNAKTTLSRAELVLSAPIDSDDFYRTSLSSRYVSGTGILDVSTNTKNKIAATPTIIRHVADPIQERDAANKSYVDSKIKNLNITPVYGAGFSEETKFYVNTHKSDNKLIATMGILTYYDGKFAGMFAANDISGYLWIFDADDTFKQIGLTYQSTNSSQHIFLMSNPVTGYDTARRAAGIYIA